MSNLMFLFNNTPQIILDYQGFKPKFFRRSNSLKNTYKSTDLLAQAKIRLSLFRLNVAKNATIDSNNEYNQKINLQLKNFFKIYKYEKLVSNYKEFNKQIKKVSLPSILIKKGTNYDHRLVTQKAKLDNSLFLQSKAQIASPIMKVSDLSGQSLNNNTKDQFDIRSNSTITYNTLKQLLSSFGFRSAGQAWPDLAGQLSASQLKSVVLQDNNRQAYFTESVTFFLKEEVKQKHRTYCFLQILLAKNLETTSFLFIKNFANYDIPIGANDYKSGLINSDYKNLLQTKKFTGINQQHDLHFLFNKINNKSFLGYWLIPIAGFAFITPKILYHFETPVLLSSVNRYPNNFLQEQVLLLPYKSTDLLAQAKGRKTRVLQAKPISKVESKADLSFYLPSSKQNRLSFDQYGQSLIIKKTFNNLYNFIKAKTIICSNNIISLFSFNSFLLHKPDYIVTQKMELYEKIIFKLCSAKQGSPEKMFDLSSWPIKPDSNMFTCFKNIFVTNRLDTLFINPGLVIKNQSKVLSRRLLYNQVNTLKSLLYLSTINPLYSKTFINNNVNFIFCKNALKLLKMKILKFNKQSNLKPTNFIYKKTKKENKIKTIFLKQPKQKPFAFGYRSAGQHSYKEGLDLITLNLKPNFIFLNKFKKLDDSKFNFKPVFPYAILYKQSRVFSKQPMLNYLENKNQVLLNYFLKKPEFQPIISQLFLNSPCSYKSPQIYYRPKANLNDVIQNNNFLTDGNKHTLQKKLLFEEHVYFLKNPVKSKLNLIKTIIDLSLQINNNFKVLCPVPLNSNNFLILKKDLNKNLNKNFDQSNFLDLNQLKNLKKSFLNKRFKTNLTNFQLAFGYRSAGQAWPDFCIRKSQANLGQLSASNINNFSLSSKNKSICLPTLSILLKHQKMFKNKTIIKNVRLHLQKKRKAKKQRLETRRQKKRTRFFPRPIWLRYRMFLNFINQRKSSKKLVDKIKTHKIIGKGKINGSLTELSYVKINCKSIFKTKNLSFNKQDRNPSKVAAMLRTIRYYNLSLSTQKELINRLKFIKKAPKLAKSFGLTEGKSIKSYLFSNFRQLYNQVAKHKEQYNYFRWPKLGLTYLTNFQFAFGYRSLINPLDLLVSQAKSGQLSQAKFGQLSASKLRTNLPSATANKSVDLSAIANKSVDLSVLSIQKDLVKAEGYVFNKLQCLQNYFNTFNTKKSSKSTKFKKFNLNINLRDIKLKANYINFKNQKTNNPPPIAEKDKDKDTMFRDFWIWAYNNALINNSNQNLEWLLPNNTSVFIKQLYPAISKTKQTKNVFAITRINWALDKTNNNNNNNYNKRYNLWGTQKLRNQSKNNKTKFLEKQFKNSILKFFLNKNLNLFYKKIKIVFLPVFYKLNYLTSYTNHLIFKQPSAEKNIKVFNTSWWSNLNTKIVVNNTYLLNKQHDIFLITSNNGRSIFNFKPAETAWRLINKNSTVSLLMSSTVLLHLCALISIVSISQVRCFVKFHLILLYKLSNVYNSLIHKTSDFIQTYLPKVKNQTSKTNNLIKYILPKTSNQHSVHDVLLRETGCTSLIDLKQNQNKLLTYFSFNLFFKKKYKLFIKSSILNIYLLKNVFFLKNFFCLRSGQVWPAKSGLVWPAKRPSQKHGRIQAIYSKLNIISLKSANIKLTNIKLIKELLVNKKSSFLNHKRVFCQTKLFFIFFTNLFSLYLFKSSKNMFKYNWFNLIDLLGLIIRNISSFFEKPAEFTTTWIAYGFLVEWSSDLITIIPENVDVFIWNVFSKILRIMPIQLVLNFNYSFLSSSLIEFSSTKSHINSLISFNKKTELVNISGLPVLLTISHLLHRRILYLFDTLIETISQPDADLIARQEKGTLFWEIWADFLVTAADYYNVNVAALSTIKAEQNTLIENISNDFGTLVSPINIGARKNKYNKKSNGQASLIKPYFEQTKKRPLYVNDLCSPRDIQNNSLMQLNYYFLDKKFKKEINQASLSNKFGSLTQNPKLESVLANLNRWSVNQYITYQSWHSHNGSNNSNGDLFIDYHPPKSFSHIPAIKYNSILQQPIGTLVCQIYSGIFNKQTSKNILLVNTKTTTKQVFTDYNVLLIQALAGETELKIITDNAQRYALVNRGFAIGIKLLRDVFDAIALNTPCIFLLEDIHAIGERRPMLISDYGGALSDDNGSFKEDFFGSQRDEVHEKNQVVYQLTRHAITHYKKPFKGDYSLAIPTNLYLTDLFLKLPTQSTSNLSLIFAEGNHNLTIKNKIKNHSTSFYSERTGGKLHASLNKGRKNSHLQIAQTVSNITPPSTSPFSVLLLKEEKKLKPNRLVEELPWTGLPGEQLATKPRTSYSVRAKVAMLAELSLSNLSAKLDMITDLLVIIDSVRSNKGFVVFATTDVPHVLDPALRRPGRLDETICLPNINNSTILNFNTNYEIFKSVKPILNRTLSSYKSQRIYYRPKANYDSQYLNSFPANKQKNLLWVLDSILTVNLKDYNTVLGAAIKQASMGLPIAKYSENSSLNYALISHSKKLKQQNIKKMGDIKGVIKDLLYLPETLQARKYSEKSSKATSLILKSNETAYEVNIKKKTLINLSTKKMRHSLNKKNKDKAIAYYEVGKVLLNYYLNNNLTYKMIGDPLTLKSINYLVLFSSKNKLMLQLMLLFGGKIGQLLGSKNLVHSIKSHTKKSMKNGFISSFKTSNLLDFDMSQIFEGNDNLRIATSILLSFIHKRYLYRKNLIVPKLLSFTDGNVLEEPPCPPFSSLLIPAKRFENYKRVFRDSIVGDKMGQRKAQISFIEKLQSHTQLLSIDKKLNKYINQVGSIKSSNEMHFSSMQGTGEEKELTKKLTKKEPLLTAQQDFLFKSIGSLSTIPGENLLQTTTNINWYYQNRILKRHGQYLTNQWWNGQLSEHNAETVFLSDIDWRSSFIKNNQISVIKSKNLFALAPNKTNGKEKINGLDILLDFPDTDQYYNPRRRRWLLNKGYWSFWFNFDKVYSEEMISTWILESIIQTYKYLHNNTELLDFVTNKFIVLGYPKTDLLNNKKNVYSTTELSSVKEILLTNSFKRF